MATLEINELHYGNNLEAMRQKILDEIAELLYRDPFATATQEPNLVTRRSAETVAPAVARWGGSPPNR